MALGTCLDCEEIYIYIYTHIYMMLDLRDKARHIISPYKIKETHRQANF